MKSLLLFAVIYCVLTPIFSQDSTSSDISMITNRPGFTEASRAVFKSGFQIETGFQYQRSPNFKGSEFYTDDILTPNLGLLYGVSNNLELRVFGNLSGSTNNWGSKNGYDFSFTGLTIGAKINLTKAKGAVPELALLITEGIPTNGKGEIFSTSTLLAWSYGLPANFGISGNFGYTIEYDFDKGTQINHPNYFRYTLNLGYSIKENIGIYAEAYGTSNIGDGTGISTSMTGGAWYRFNPKLQVDLLGGYGFNDGGYLFNAGFSWLILK